MQPLERIIRGTDRRPGTGETPSEYIRRLGEEAELDASLVVRTDEVVSRALFADGELTRGDPELVEAFCAGVNRAERPVTVGGSYWDQRTTGGGTESDPATPLDESTRRPTGADPGGEPAGTDAPASRLSRALAVLLAVAFLAGGVLALSAVRRGAFDAAPLTALAAVGGCVAAVASTVAALLARTPALPPATLRRRTGSTGRVASFRPVTQTGVHLLYGTVAGGAYPWLWSAVSVAGGLSVAVLTRLPFALVTGVGYGVVLYGLVVVSDALGLVERDPDTAWSLFVFHLLYGLALGAWIGLLAPAFLA